MQTKTPTPPLPLRPETESLEASKIVEVWELGFGRPDLIGLWVGEGDLPTPDFISRPAIEALQAGKTFYTHKRGLPELRQAIASYTRALYGVELADDRIHVTSAGMNGIILVTQAILRPGDEVIVLSPIWPNAREAIRIAGAKVVEVALDERADGGFSLDIEKLAAAITAKTRAVFVASPGNPTGWMMERDEQQALLDLLRARGVWLIADEVYNRFVYDRPVAPSFLEIAGAEDPVVVVNSFSKAWAMTGWRLGWLVMPPSLMPAMDSLLEFNTSGAPPFLQEGAIAALNEGEPFVKEMVERCRRGGELVYEALGDLPRVALAKPQAAFYAFFKVEGVDDSLAFAKEILAETGVGLAPGSAFGAAGEGRIRLCFACSEPRLAEALERLRPMLR